MEIIFFKIIFSKSSNWSILSLILNLHIIMCPDQKKSVKHFLSHSTFLIHVRRNVITLPSFSWRDSILHWFFLFCVKEIQKCHPECPSCWNNLCAQITVNWAGFVPHNGILNLQFFSQLLFSRSLLHKFTQRFCPFQQQTKIAKMGRTKYQSLHLHLSNDHCQICFLM